MDPRDLLAQRAVPQSMWSATAADALAHRAVPVSLSPHSTSYFSAPRPTLDPALFDGDSIRGSVRRAQLTDVTTYLNTQFRNPEAWATLWLAGSSASYLWSGTDPGDLDLLVGIHYHAFRRANPGFDYLSDEQISAYLNRFFQGFNGRWGRYDRTLYSNPGATDIRSINPYAAFNLTDNTWTVHPDPDAHAPDSPDLRLAATAFDARAGSAISDYDTALEDYHGAPNEAGRLNAAVRVRRAADAASSLFDELHHGRKLAFAPGGLGYTDPHQYAWAAGKASGAVQALHAIKAERSAAYANPDSEADRVLIDAALYRRSR